MAFGGPIWHELQDSICFVGTIPADGLPKDIENRIAEIIILSKNFNKETFVPRPNVEPVKNCSKIPAEARTNLTIKIFNHLLNIDSSKLDGWRIGGSDKLGNVMNILTNEEKGHLRLQNGGLQTFIKNQHQVFTVRNGNVSIRNWLEENEKFLLKQKDVRKSACWFLSNHPNGCPFAAGKCAFKH